MTTEKTPNDKIIHLCQMCEFSSLKYSDFERHISTNKHSINTINSNNLNVVNKQVFTYKCECGKRFNHRGTLHNHAKGCYGKEKTILSNSNTDTVMGILQELVSQNAEFKRELQLIITTNEEFHKNIMEKLNYISNNINKNGNQNNTNNKNKPFNINIFLSEKCNYAMNLPYFVDSIVLTFADLERVGSVGYVEGISDIFITQLNKIDVCNRPVHCTNAKREIIFVKNDGSWIIDTNNDKIRNAIKRITKLNIDMIQHWCNANPLARKSSNNVNDKYLTILLQAMGGKGDIQNNENKIIKRIARHIIITN